MLELKVYTVNHHENDDGESLILCTSCGTGEPDEDQPKLESNARCQWCDVSAIELKEENKNG